MGSCLSIEETHETNIADKKHNARRGAKNVTSLRTKHQRNVQRNLMYDTKLSKQYQTVHNKSRLYEDNLPSRRSSSKKKTLSMKDTPILREVNNISSNRQRTVQEKPIEKKQNVSTIVENEDEQFFTPPDDTLTKQVASVTTPWASGTLIQQRVSQLFRSYPQEIEEDENNENVAWKGLVKQRQSVFQDGNLSTNHRESNLSSTSWSTPKNIGSSSSKDVGIVHQNSREMKENTFPSPLSSGSTTIVQTFPKNLKEASMLEALSKRNRKENHESRRLIDEKKETAADARTNEEIDMERWKNRRTRRIMRNSVLMDEQEDPELVAARNMRGSVLRAHSSMRFQF